MLDQLGELYREVILEHYQRPTHRGELPEAQIKVDGNNPLCGDDLAFHIRLNGDRVEKVRFQGHGCAISQATASMLSQAIEGKHLKEVGQLIALLRQMMQGKELDESQDIGDLEALAGVRKFPVRIKCAALAWNVIEQGLNEGQNHGSH